MNLIYHGQSKNPQSKSQQRFLQSDDIAALQGEKKIAQHHQGETHQSREQSQLHNRSQNRNTERAAFIRVANDNSDGIFPTRGDASQSKHGDQKTNSQSAGISFGLYKKFHAKHRGVDGYQPNSGVKNWMNCRNSLKRRLHVNNGFHLGIVPHF